MANFICVRIISNYYKKICCLRQQFARFILAYFIYLLYFNLFLNISQYFTILRNTYIFVIRYKVHICLITFPVHSP